MKRRIAIDMDETVLTRHGLLFSAEHNMKVQGYDRVDDWPHVVQKILG